MWRLDRLYFYLTGKLYLFFLWACSGFDKITGLDSPDEDEGNNETMEDGGNGN